MPSTPTPDPPADNISDTELRSEKISRGQDEPKNSTEIVRPHADLWQQLSSEFNWNYPDDPAIRRAITSIQQHRRDFERASERATPFLWHVADELRRRKLPAELALVPLIESGWQAHAQSPRGATGLWQFMPTTGRRFGLKQTRWYDARRDVVASTRAALDYFEHLTQRFEGDWLLAVAAYNCGPTKVRRALKNNPSSDFWTIAADLPPETRRYIPRLLAAIHIVGDPIANQIALHPIPNKPAFTRLDLKSPISLHHLYGVKGWSKADFAELNPGFSRDHTAPFGPHEILVPIALAQQVADALASIPADQRLPSRIHIVKSGDTLSKIAAHYDVNLFELKAHNKLRGNLIRIGKELVVPMPGQSNSEIATQGRRPEAKEHIVKRGDSLWTIARRYGATSQAIAKLNRLAITSTLHPGQVLRVDERHNGTLYAVVRGDSLWGIARKFKVSIEQLQIWNNLSRHRVLQPGELLNVSNPNSARHHELNI